MSWGLRLGQLGRLPLADYVAAVALYVAHYNLCRVHEALKIARSEAVSLGLGMRGAALANKAANPGLPCPFAFAIQP